MENNELNQNVEQEVKTETKTDSKIIIGVILAVVGFIVFLAVNWIVGLMMEIAGCVLQSLGYYEYTKQLKANGEKSISYVKYIVDGVKGNSPVLDKKSAMVLLVGEIILLITVLWALVL